MITAVTLDVTQNMIPYVEPKQNRHCLVGFFFHSEDVKIVHFKPPSSSDVTKIKDTCYIE